MRDNLIEHAEMARLSRRLVELARDVPLEHPLEELTLQGIPEAPLKAFLEHHGFRSLLARLGAVADAPVAAPAADVVLPDAEPCDPDAYETVIDAAPLDRWIPEARTQDRTRVRQGQMCSARVKLGGR